MIKSLTKLDAQKIIGLYSGDFSDGWNKDMLLSAFDTERFYALGKILDGDLIGIITFMVSGADADLETIYVRGDFRKQGVASELLDSAVSLLKTQKIEKFFLEVREGNVPARKFYVKKNFTEVSVRKKYYSDGENALVMVKEL